MKTITRFLAILACAGFMLAAASPAQAAAYPEKPITLIVPFPPGGRTDLVSRIVAHNLEKQLHASIAVVNRPGAGGVVGALEVARAKPDGYTVGIFSSAVVSAQYTVETPTDLKAFVPVGLIEISPAALAVRASAPWKDVKEFAAYAKANPGKITMGMIPGASAQVFAGAITEALNIKVTYVPFNGDSPGAIALAGGHIQSHVAVPVSYNTLIAAKKIRMLAIAADQRSKLYPDVPTFTQAGFPLVVGSFHALFAPKGTPENVLSTLEAALLKALADPTAVDQMHKAGLEIAGRNRADTAKFIADQDKTYHRLIERLGMMYKKK